MKKIIFISLIGLIFFGCDNKEVTKKVEEKKVVVKSADYYVKHREEAKKVDKFCKEYEGNITPEFEINCANAKVGVFVTGQKIEVRTDNPRVGF